MGITVAIMAQGTMGAGVGKLPQSSAAPRCRTLLSGRSEASAGRAKAAGMQPAADERDLLSGADYFLSILPPDQAEGLAARLAPALQSLAKKPVYVDCNAVSPQTAGRIAAIIEPTGAAFVDGGIIGGPPREGYSPAIYASGPQAERTKEIGEFGHRLADHGTARSGRRRGSRCPMPGSPRARPRSPRRCCSARHGSGCAEALLGRIALASQPEMLRKADAARHPRDVRQGLSLGRRDGGN